MPSLPTVRELPSVRLALRWLIRGRGNSSDRAVLIRAHASGLVRSGTRGHWQANGRMATRLAHWAMRRIPSDPMQLGSLLHGLGEIDAHAGDAQFAQRLIEHLRRRRYPRRRIIAILDAAAQCETKIKGPISLDILAFAQWISRSQLSWGTFHDAVTRVERVYDTSIRGNFGLKFAARIILAVDPHAIDAWIAKRVGQPIVAVIGSAVVNAVAFADSRDRLIPLLASRTPAIECLAAASLIYPNPFRPAAVNYRDGHRVLVKGGIASGDATWMMGLRMKEAIHHRYRLEDRREKSEARLHYLERNPDAAIGGPHNFDAELRSLRAQLEDVSKLYGKLLPELEQMLSDMVAVWPVQGLSDQQMTALENIFVETPEIRHRLAEKLAHPGNRAWLLKRNIAQLQEFIELKHFALAGTNYFYPDEKRFAIIAPWAAQSLILLHSADHRGIGKRTSDLVGPLAKASLRLLAQPFIAVRQPTEWQSIVTRSACADIFALMVVACVPEGRRDGVLTLNGLALGHVFELLRGPLPEQHPPRVFHQLVARAVHQMNYQKDADSLRRSWALADDLPAFPRALALWSSAALVEAHAALAFELLRRVGELPLSLSRIDDQLSHLLTLLDVAVAASAAAGKHDLLSSITKAWDEIYKDWLRITGRFAHAAELLAAAVAKDGPERAAMLADPAWAHSVCRHLIDSGSPKPIAI
jgi:hypothetical protein